jgi:hypothetical protein
LVISYQTKYASLVRQVSFLENDRSVILQRIGFFGVFCFGILGSSESCRAAQPDLQLLSERTAALSEELAMRKGELSAAQESLRAKEMAIAEHREEDLDYDKNDA